MLCPTPNETGSPNLLPWLIVSDELIPPTQISNTLLRRSPPLLLPSAGFSSADNRSGCSPRSDHDAVGRTKNHLAGQRQASTMPLDHLPDGATYGGGSSAGQEDNAPFSPRLAGSETPCSVCALSRLCTCWKGIARCSRESGTSHALLHVRCIEPFDFPQYRRTLQNVDVFRNRWTLRQTKTPKQL